MSENSLFKSISRMADAMSETHPHARESVDLMTGKLPVDGHGRAYYPRIAIFGAHGGRYKDHAAGEPVVPTDDSGFAPEGWRPLVS
jgi:hypothetical protein